MTPRIWYLRVNATQAVDSAFATIPVDLGYLQTVAQDTEVNLLYLTVVQNGEVMSFPSNAYVEVVVNKPDATTWVSTGEILESGQVKINLPYQAVVALGVAHINVKVFTDTQILTIPPFQIRIILDPNDGTNGDIVSASEYPILTGLINAVQAAGTADQNASEVAYSNTTSGLTATNVQTAIDEVVVEKVQIYNNAGFHNSIFRGKYLGSSVTEAQYTAISSGTFEDLYIGDYWTIGGVNYRIAAFNYYYNTGDTDFTTNHAVIVPDGQLYTHVMNDTNITTGAYVGSKMYVSGLNSAKTTINAAFIGHVRSYRNYLHNAVTSGYASGGAWYDSTVDLMTEANVYGTKHYGNATQGTNLANNIYVDKSQFPLFALNPQSINNRQDYWLRDVASSTTFAVAGGLGLSRFSGGSVAFGVRPAFCIS